MSVDVVVVNYRTASLVCACLDSLAADAASGAIRRVIVVDNASGDGSVAQLHRHVGAFTWQDRITILPLQHNRGYAAGNNAAMKLLLTDENPPELILLLNPDTEVHPGAIQAMTAKMNQQPKAGIVGSRLEGADGQLQCSSFRFPSVMSELESTSCVGVISRLTRRWIISPEPSPAACPVDWVAGASMLVRRAVFEQVGLLDEAYFLYFEEVDFCRRAHRNGWACWYCPEARVVHHVGASTGVTALHGTPRRRPAYWFASRRRYFVKHHGLLYTTAADAAWVCGHLIRRLRRRLLREPDPTPPRILSDFFRHSTGLSST